MIESTGERDFFISFNKADAAWATWIAWVLEGAGYEVVFQHWDMGPGSNFIVEMQRAITRTRQTVLVLSDAALQSDYVTAEWAAALAADPSGRQRKLIPVRVKPLTLPLGLLGQVVYVDLVELGAEDAKNALLGALLKRRKTHEAPLFPKEFPGKEGSDDLCRRLRDALARKSGTKSAASATVDRRELAKSLEQLAVPYFNILLEALKVPAGVVPQMPSSHDERVGALLDWSEGDGVPPSVVRALVADVLETVATATPLDQLTPDPLVKNAVDSCDDRFGDNQLADLEELGRAYIEVEQWPKAFFTFRTLVDLAAERHVPTYARGLRYLGKVHLEYREYANAERSLKQSLAVWDRYLKRAPGAQGEAEKTRALLEELEQRSTGVAAPQKGDGPVAATR